MSADGNAVSSGSGGTRNIFATRWLRNILVQTFIVGLIVFAVVYFVNNAQVNLLRRSGNFGLGFMATPGSYDPSPFFPIPLKNNDLVFRFLALGLHQHDHRIADWYLRGDGFGLCHGFGPPVEQLADRARCDGLC